MADANILHEVRALLRQFVKSDFRSCDVRTADMAIFFSRDPSIRPEAATAPASLGAVSELCAPHIGTLAELAGPGTAIPAGGVYGKLAVLDELRELIAQTGGTIAEHRRAIGELIEYGQPIVTVAG